MLFTNQEVAAQKERFNSFMLSVNLRKLGERYSYLSANDNKDGKYNGYCYILRVLKMLAKVQGCMYMPSSNLFYNEIITKEAVRSFYNAL